jgi:hypothetical protein
MFSCSRGPWPEPEVEHELPSFYQQVSAQRREEWAVASAIFGRTLRSDLQFN